MGGEDRLCEGVRLETDGLSKEKLDWFDEAARVNHLLREAAEEGKVTKADPWRTLTCSKRVRLLLSRGVQV